MSANNYFYHFILTNPRTMEAPLHPVRSFVGRVVLFGVNKGQTIKADGDLVMHSHTGQVIVGTLLFSANF